MTWTILILLPIAAIVALFAIKPLRRAVVTRPIFAAYRKMLPQMSQTEKEAIEAGSVWWEGELFHGRPDWNKLLAVDLAGSVHVRFKIVNDDQYALPDVLFRHCHRERTI